MFEYQISESIKDRIRHAVQQINKKCTYTPIWYLSEKGVVSKTQTEKCLPIPTTFQINDLYNAYVDDFQPFPVSYFLQHVGLSAFYYPGIHLYEAFIFGLAHLLSMSNVYQKEDEPSPQEDPFTK